METSQGGSEYDTIIIGCGMAGLAAGIRLAMFDKRVLILEKHNAPGGLNSFYFQSGRKFDVGLHAVTNYVDAGTKGTPLAKIFRQLRIPRDAFGIWPQTNSRVAFPGVDLRFANNFGLLEEDVAAAFPDQIDGFRNLRKTVLSFDALDLEAETLSAREVVQRYISDPILEDMLFCPLMYYGSAREHDMDFDQFVTLWQAVFEEGFGRPLEGVRVIIRALLDKFRSVGGERRMRCGVRKIITEGDRSVGVETLDGTELRARQIISTAGRAETEVLCGNDRESKRVNDLVGKLSFAETINVLSCQPADLGAEETIIFFNNHDRFQYVKSDEPIDLRSGVLCFPNNYQYPDGKHLEEGFLRVTALANYATWTSYGEETYQREKEDWFSRILENAIRFVPGMEAEAVSRNTIYKDMFTPRTVEKFTSHFGGAVYGSPSKARTGETDYKNLYLAGTDQGFLGIVGAMLSGISMANRHVLTR